MIFLKIITITFVIFFSNNIYSQIMIFDNFDNKDSKEWEFVSDQVMGGISFGTYKFIEENNINFIKLSGKVSLENNGGFIQARKKFIHKSKLKFKKIIFKARGNNLDYYIHLRTKYTLLPWQYYQAKFSVTSKWTSFNIYLKDFKRSGRMLPKDINSQDIRSIALVAFGKEQIVDLDVSQINLAHQNE